VATSITEDEFRTIQSQLTVNDPVTVMIMSGRCLAVVQKIGASKDFDEYKRIVRAEHPPVKNSLADRVTELERNQENILNRVVALEDRNGLTQTSLLEES
jgi:hypothetical protein